MNELRPEIAPLAAATTHAARAEALMRMSYSTLMTCEFAIRSRLRVAGFVAGLAYLDSRLALLRAPRDGRGRVAEDLRAGVTEPWKALRRVAQGGEAPCAS